MAYIRTDLRLLSISGPDARNFLGGLISQSTDLPVGSGAYGALLTPQGKLLVDFPILFVGEEEMVLALPEQEFEATMKKLTMFKLRSQVSLQEISDQTLESQIGAPSLAYGDSRHAGLSHGLTDTHASGDSAEAFHTARGALGVPEGLHDLEIGKSTLLDEGLANAVSWDKGCYMGQEVTARMRYRALIKRVLVPFTGIAKAGVALMDGERRIGVVRSSYDGCGFAYVQKDWAGREIDSIQLGHPLGLAELGL